MTGEPYDEDWRAYRKLILKELETLHREIAELRKEIGGLRELQTKMNILGAAIVLVAGAFLGYVFKLFQ